MSLPHLHRQSPSLIRPPAPPPLVSCPYTALHIQALKGRTDSWPHPPNLSYALVGQLRCQSGSRHGYRRRVPPSLRWRERLERAANEAVTTVCSTLSVNRVPGQLLLSRDINKYCRFIWRNASALNYNRCGRASEQYWAETCLGIRIPDDHLSGCAVYPSPDSPAVTVLRPEGAGLPDTDFLLYLHTQSTDKCRAEVRIYTPAVIGALQKHLHSPNAQQGALLENQVATHRSFTVSSNHLEPLLLQGQGL
ncbi:hypothetical protein AAFF_G00277530 [Aldrovandia affinis]|uniref:Uncharacterized protein n=1 Tax=Aldrovandia affinis TaxID=143900 RepID=A0AAD7RAJ8_9TELE|nr:hypothetical protein AAFF_G00277530 [Aldrovandia affinis]